MGTDPLSSGRFKGPFPPRWTYALVVVAAAQLLTTAGSWRVTDHAEQLLMARRLLTKGTLHLWDPGDPPLRRYGTFSQRTDPTLPVRSRFLPVASITLLPLLWIDQTIGWGEPAQFGRLVHLQGHLLVLGGLVVLGVVLRRTGASQAATAVAVSLTGLSWPTWMVARHVGPESVLVLAVSTFMAGVILERQGFRWSAHLQALACALMPWVSPTGLLIDSSLVLGLVVGHLGEGRGLGDIARKVFPSVLGTGVGVGSVLYFWNHLYEGNWIQGGYASYAVPFVWRNPTPGLLECLESLSLGAPALLGALLYAVFKKPGMDLGRGVALSSSLLLPIATSFTLLFGFNIPLTRAEASRRLVVLMPIFGGVVGTCWDSLRVPPRVARLLVGVAFLPMFAFLPEEGNYIISAQGVFFSPCLWVNLVQKGYPWWIPAGCVLVLLSCLAWGGRRLWLTLEEGSEGSV